MGDLDWIDIAGYATGFLISFVVLAALWYLLLPIGMLCVVGLFVAGFLSG